MGKGKGKGKRQEERRGGGRDKEKEKEKEKEKGEKKVMAEALGIIDRFPRSSLPRLVVFDLDYTLWPFYSESVPTRELASLYLEAKGILCALKERSIPMAIASCASKSAIAQSLLHRFGIQSMFVAQEIVTTSCHKREHFERIKRATGFSYASMLFFDDDPKNIHTVSKMGVSCTLVKKGIDLESFELALEKFTSI